MPAEIGYIYDEKSDKTELLAELIYLQSKSVRASYQETIKNILSLSYNDLKDIFSAKPVTESTNTELHEFETSLEKRLLQKKIIRTPASRKYARKSQRSFDKVKRISKYITLYPQLVLFFLSASVLTISGESLSIDQLIIFPVLIVVIFYIHTFTLYVLDMLRIFVFEKGSVKSLDKNNQSIDRTLWDQIRGYKEYLKRVELNRTRSFIETRDRQALSQDHIPYLSALGLVSNRDSLRILRILKQD
jgi:hypothetical protein